MASAATVIHSESSTTPGLRHRVPAQLLGGSTSIHEGLLGPKELVPPHTHANEDQCLYVVSGTVHLEIGEELIEARMGTYVIKPREARPCLLESSYHASARARDHDTWRL